MKKISRVLIANRGEIACRAIRSIREMGLSSVAVYSPADASSLHVKLADEAVALGGGPASENYLDIERVLEAAKLIFDSRDALGKLGLGDPKVVKL